MRARRSQAIPLFPLDEFRPRDASDPFLRVGRFEEGMQRMPHRFRAHRHEFFELIWLTRGTGEVQVDFQTYSVASHHLVVLAPGQVHAWSLSKDFSGVVLGFYRELFSLMVGATDFFLELPFFEHGRAVIQPQSARTAREIYRLFLRLQRESVSEARGAARMQCALVTELLTLAERELPEEKEQAGDDRLAKRFLKALGHGFKAREPLTVYAAQLGVSANHLGDAVKRSTGRPPGEWLRERVVLEAKRLLAHSDLTAAEIGYALGFSDAAYFGNAFRRATAQSPGAFREAFRKKLQNRWR